jgi:hypothetical protein
VERLVATTLAGWGYRVERTPFLTSAARLYAASIAGAGMGWLSLLLVPLFVLPLPGWTVLLVGVGGMLSIAAAGLGVAEGHLRVRGPEVEARNLEARRGRPQLWLVAHSDSKRQAFSLRARVVGASCLVLGAAGLVMLLALRLSGTVAWWQVLAVTLPMLVGGGVLSRSAPQGNAPGAVDNASGMVAVLVAAHELRDRADVGVLISGAEEFGMVGARIWAATGPPGAMFINVDGVDARGPHRVMTHRSRGGGLASPSRIARALACGLHRPGRRVREGRLPPGVLVDGIVLARAGLDGVTVSRGDWQTLGVVHTHRDTPARLDPEAAIETGMGIAAAVRDLLVDAGIRSR